MMGEVFAYFAGRSSGRRDRRPGVSPPASARDIRVMRALALLFLICAVLVVLTAV